MHICQIFSNGSDTLAPYFKAGLENNERVPVGRDGAIGADETRSA
jgi:hypothetical protein